MVEGDSFRLRQCLINLCDNGIKFSKDEGGEVRLSIKMHDTMFPPLAGQNNSLVLGAENTEGATGGGESGKEEKQMSVVQPCWQFDVTDNGMGIPLDKQNVLFKPFSQVSSHYARRHGGTGMSVLPYILGHFWYGIGLF